MEEIKLGMIGTGRIARRFVAECEVVSGIRLTSVYNPREKSANAFAAEFHLRDFCDLDAFFENIDAVYIASPHETHGEYIGKALDAKKHILCEKPICLSVSQAKSLYERADALGLVMMEGIKTAYCPGFQKVLALAESGTIGEVREIEACFTKLEHPASRELTDTMYGGSMTELGSYVLLPVAKLMKGDYENWEISFDSLKADNGLDTFTKIHIRTFGLANGTKFSTLTCGLGVKLDGRLLIAGSLGYILVPAPWWKTRKIEVHFEDPSKTEYYEEAFEGDGLRYELGEFVKRCHGKDETNRSLSDEESIAIIGVMEKFLEEDHREKL